PLPARPPLRTELIVLLARQPVRPATCPDARRVEVQEARLRAARVPEPVDEERRCDRARSLGQSSRSVAETELERAVQQEEMVGVVLVDVRRDRLLLGRARAVEE